MITWRCRNEGQMLIKNCKKTESNLSFSYENIASYQKNKPSKQCTALNVFFHYRKLINFTVSLR